MPGLGKRFKFFGAFKSKKKAVAAERKHPGTFIIPTMIMGSRRFEVVKPKK